MLKHKPLYLVYFFFQFAFILALGIRDTLSFVARGYTAVPAFFQAPANKVEAILSTSLGERMDPVHPVRQAISVYTRMAGIESGYAFFAPNVPDSYKLVFELHYPDGRLEYDLPHVSSSSAGLRLAVLLDHLGETRSDELREVIIKMVAYTVWQAHPDAAMVRAVFGFSLLPTASEFRNGVRESNEFLYAYDFVFAPPPVQTTTP